MHVYFRQGFAHHHHHRADRHPIFYERVDHGGTPAAARPRAADGPDAPSSAPAAARARAPRVRGAGGGIILVSNRLLGE